ncbi:E3 ubiquitin-protein ligase RNF180 [Triplophysa rosa]|uniref:E3 ubiquitin-protein ligase RNF180 n=1 Tax=Triplophysa rosa TaxID=992332 RepID=A0A9W7TGR5_TRIRA|nr:E3 ubiquitin-protein ligase RNF180 [Triplophysa rosa]KAI7796163.1 RING finger protein 180 [Triplophysa rosa]
MEMDASFTTKEQDLSETLEDPTNLRCKKCRRCLIDSTSLLKIATSGEAEAMCSVWHLNVDTLPDWIVASINQVHWTVGKINCQYCGARLGGFNFINCSKCTCGHNTVVHLSKSRVDQDFKPQVLLTRPGRSRGHTERRVDRVASSPQTRDSVTELQRTQIQSSLLDTLPSSSTFSSSCDVLRAVTTGDETELEIASSEDPQIVRTVEVGTDGSLPFESIHPTQLSDYQEILEEHHVDSASQSRASPVDPEDVRPRNIVEPSTNVSPIPQPKLSKREKNRLKSLRRKQRKKEHWIQKQQQTKDLALKWDLTSSDEEEKEGYTCAVCLEVYYSPYKCHPCSHVFCEPCLRTLAKNRPSHTPCPLCRTLISHVLFQEELNLTTKACFPKVYWSRHETFQKTNYSKWPLPDCPKRFRIFWGFQRHVGPASRWQFPHRAFGLNVLDLGDMWGWPFDVDFMIISIYSLHWVLALIIFCALCYFFLL